MEMSDLLDLSQHYLGVRLGGTGSQDFLRRVDQPAPFTLWDSFWDRFGHETSCLHGWPKVVIWPGLVSAFLPQQLFSCP